VTSPITTLGPEPEPESEPVRTRERGAGFLGAARRVFVFGFFAAGFGFGFFAAGFGFFAAGFFFGAAFFDVFDFFARAMPELTYFSVAWTIM
jgi:hypothetical protein